MKAGHDRHPPLRIALTGCANVGKSTLFNRLTGLHQHLGNWPGKTVECAEGTLHYRNHTIDIVDLPGMASLSSYSAEELLTREYLLSTRLNCVIVVIDATSLESNLILLLQLLELEIPLVVAVNMMDIANKRGITLDLKQLSQHLKVPIVPLAAATGRGVAELVDTALKLIHHPRTTPTSPFFYGREIEAALQPLIKALAKLTLPCNMRFAALKLLEKDLAITETIAQQQPELLKIAEAEINNLENLHGHDAALVIADERAAAATRLANEITSLTKERTNQVRDLLDDLTSHPVYGYILILTIFSLVFTLIFWLGKYGGELCGQLTEQLYLHFTALFGSSSLAKFTWSGIASALSLIELVFPVVIPFYFLLFTLEDCGYLARVAYLMDRSMHLLGIHGKACMPLILGFGCNVPACLGCRIMETKRERFLTGMLATFIPCGAVTTVVVGLVGRFLGINLALLLYLILFVVTFVIGVLAARLLPGEPTELIMKVPDFRRPNFKTVVLQTWFSIREFIYVAAPLVIISGVIIEGVLNQHFLTELNHLLAPITVSWLRIPEVTGILLILGILRKELVLVTLASLVKTTNFASVLSATQMLTIATLTIFYIPCIATIAALLREFGWRKACCLTLFKISLALLIAGLVARFW